MKLRSEMIEHLAELIAEKLTKEKMIRTENYSDLVSEIKMAIADDLRIEDELNDEVHKILEGYRDEMDRSNIPYYQMFRMVKDKLAKERNLIL